MASVHFTAPSRATYGVRHANVQLTGRFTVVSNDLIQHPEMSAVARMLGIYIQSLPAGTPIGIKDLVKQLPLGETSIANGLRELVAFGYLDRSLESLPGGRIVTRTVSFNHPRAALVVAARRGHGHVAPPAGHPSVPPPPETEPVPEPAVPKEPEGAAAVGADVEPEAEPEAEPQPESPAEPAPAPRPEAESPAGAGVAPGIGLPAPLKPGDPGRRRVACEVLAELRRADPRLLLGEQDVRYLAGGVEAWLERGAGVEALVAVLSARLPEPLRNPAGLIAHRLTAQLPPPLVPLARAQAFVPPDPFVICTKCERAFRSPTPGTCRGCSP
ncbi:helix-turn-helix domain-containing protein [Streptomyces sp. AP-93]|uniref:helix-turn-helix domain-containing protein n=1 Tax=Streptomyces sp. AP-93 TaxID=2929048 RepID=UPI001FB030E4|nr:helix-turn-helix domain-containing protein [Streptomyces sp. AP-93]MCJ0873467.1 helix-turn-helix domain-containing protein [Streptomyces sp. AP-93]